MTARRDPSPATLSSRATPECPACGRAAARIFATTDRNRRLSQERFVYYRCTACSLVFLSPVPENLGAYYPAVYYAIPASREALRSGESHERYKVELVRRFVQSGRLVEVGPATGGFVALAKEAGYDASAIEMDADCCRFLEDALGVPAANTDDTVGALSAAAPFDVVALWHVIEHLPDPEETLAAAADALAPGGIIVLAAPNPESFQFRVLGRRWTHIDAPRHLRLIPISSIQAFAVRLGLEVAFVTTTDPGTLGWNAFGWRESLAGLSSGRYARHALRIVGSLLALLAAPIERSGRRGSAYTVVLRRPLEALTPTA